MALAPLPAGAHGTPSTAVPSQHAQLEGLVGIVTRHASEHLMEVVNRLVAALLEVGAAGGEPRLVYQRVKSGNLLKSNGYAYFHLAAIALEAAVRKELALLAPPAMPVRLAATEKLALVPFEEIERGVAFGAISRPFEIAYSDQIATLNVRLGLLLGRDVLRIGQNPFRPEVVLMALNDAWCEFEPEAEAHPLLQGLLTPATLFDFGPMFEALNTALMPKRALPGSSEFLRKRNADNAAKAQQSRASGQAALAQQLRQLFGTADAGGFDAELPLIPDLPAMAPGGGGWRPSGAQGFRAAAGAPLAGGAAAATGGGFGGHGAGGHGAGGHGARGHGAGGAGAQGAATHPASPHGTAQLLDLLGKMQQDMNGGPAAGSGARAAAGADLLGIPHNVFYLPRLKESMPAGSLTRGDESTIDLLSKIFETVFIDENIPPQTRELIRFLQIPVLKAALLDKDFFYQEAHPARRMIDLMSRMGWEQRHGADDPLFEAMRRGVDQVGRDASPHSEAFARAVAELEASLEAEESSAAAEMSEPIARALKQEKVTEAKRAARGAVALRVGGEGGVPVVDAFLSSQWTQVLTVAYSVEDDKPGAVGNATKTMDALLWSVKPKSTQEQRKALIAKLPGLLSTLNKWLDVIQWRDAARLRFFAELAECHASIVRAPLELSPERQLAIALEVAQHDALRRIEQEQAVVAQDEAENDEAVAAVAGLERGMWFEFRQPDGSANKVKLAWISPLRTLFIFSTGARREAFSISSEKLAEAYRAQSVRLIRQDGVVGRALSEALEQAGARQPALH
jgi:hypothetical protein